MEYVEEAKLKITEFLESDLGKWFVKFRNPAEIWENHRSFLILEAVLYIQALLTFKHAMRNGGRYRYLWFSVVLHGLVVESLSYFVPDIDNFWHGQSMVMLLGQRLPLHIVLLYPVFIYTAFVAVTRMRLKAWAEPLAVGLAVVLIDIPFDIVGIKLLFWSWHDTDPNIAERTYWVPWTSYYFHAAFASSFTFLFHGTRKIFCRTQTHKMQADRFYKEIPCSVLTGLLAMPIGILQFLPVYHPLHDLFKIHTETCVMMFLSIYVLLVWIADRNPEKDARTSPNKGWFDEIAVVVFVHYAVYLILSIVEEPQKIVSTGLHEPVGPCNENSSIRTALGMVLSKRKYLCPTDFDEGYYDFHCLPKPPAADKSNWYTICGTPVINRVEFVAVVAAFCALGLIVYDVILYRSGQALKVTSGAKVDKGQTAGGHTAGVKGHAGDDRGSKKRN